MNQLPAVNNPGDKRNLHILILEDNRDDAELALREMNKGGFNVTADTIETREQFAASLAKTDYDLILADFQLSSWTGLEALALLQDRQKDIPLILVTGMLGEETAVQCIKQGVADYVLKDRLTRLPLAATWALREQAARVERKRAELEREQLIQQLKEALAEVKKLSGLLPICAQCKKIRDDRGAWNHLESYIQTHSEAHFTHSICPDCCKSLYPEFYPAGLSRAD